MLIRTIRPQSENMQFPRKRSKVATELLRLYAILWPRWLGMLRNLLQRCPDMHILVIWTQGLTLPGSVGQHNQCRKLSGPSPTMSLDLLKCIIVQDPKTAETTPDCLYLLQWKGIGLRQITTKTLHPDPGVTKGLLMTLMATPESLEETPANYHRSHLLRPILVM